MNQVLYHVTTVLGARAKSGHWRWSGDMVEGFQQTFFHWPSEFINNFIFTSECFGNPVQFMVQTCDVHHLKIKSFESCASFYYICCSLREGTRLLIWIDICSSDFFVRNLMLSNSYLKHFWIWCVFLAASHLIVP